MFIGIFEGMTDNAYMQERAADIKDVTKRVLAHLLGVKLPSPALIDEEVIIVAEDLTPSDTAQLDKKFVKAFVTNIGGRTSHSAIMARTLEIPAVLGTNNITELVSEGQLLAVSGLTGEVILDPSTEQQSEFHKAGEAYAAQKQNGLLLKTLKLLQLMDVIMSLLLISEHLKTLKVLTITVLKQLVFIVQNSCTWMHKISYRR